VKTKRFDSTEGNVWKYVFDFKDAIAEAVLYKYDNFYKRTVLCVSVQSGCPIGCKFCGTGKKFIRNLTSIEIVGQIKYCLKNMNIKNINLKGERFQIMFMSMGEPMLNIDNVIASIKDLNSLYPNAELLVSTMGAKNNDAFEKFLMVSNDIQKVGLQFSVHEAFEEKRNKLIPFKNKKNLREIRDYGIEWNKQTSRPVYINYCISEANQSNEELNRLKDLFSPSVFNFTFSVICSADETMKDKGYRELSKINCIASSFIESGYNVRVFDPAGQDDIGGGCGQLFHVQKWMQDHHKVK
jgi:23S rRNA (adenine2503-C2)-methyltransferase